MTALAKDFGELVKETRDLLACPDLTPEAWVEYGKRREAIFASLSEKDFHLAGEEKETVRRLIEEILDQSKMVEEGVGRALSLLRREISLLARDRRALKGYARPRSSMCLEICA